MRQAEEWRELLDHAGFVRALARRLAADEHAAADLAQETWRAALARPPARADSPRPWLGTLARNAARKALRGDSRRRERERLVARAESQPSTSDLAERAASARRVIDAVLALPDSQREVVLLRFYDELSVRSVARRLSCSSEAVKSRTARALVQLRRRLDADFGTENRALWLALSPSGALSLPTCSKLIVAVMSTRILASIGLLLLVALAGWKFANPGPTPRDVAHPTSESERPESAEVSEVESESAPVAVDHRSPALAPAAPELRVRGRVVDRMGRPVAEARVALLAEQDPFLALDETTLGWNQYVGRQFPTDLEGRFDVLLPEHRRVLVTVLRSPRYRLMEEGRDELWVAPPAEGIEFVVEHQDTAVLQIRLLDSPSGQLIENFKTVARIGGGGLYARPSEAGMVSYEFPVPDPEGVEVSISLTKPRTPEPVVRNLHLAPGEEREIELVLGEAGFLDGRVLDQHGLPIASALVWYGHVSDGRGDEPFRPFKPDRISGTRSGVDGSYRLAGAGEVVSAWHEEYGASTVTADDALRIVLPDRGELHGVLRDGAGMPVVGALVSLDRERSMRTDVAGSFAFDSVLPGMRGLELEDGRRFAVWIESGEVEQLSLEVGIPSLSIRFVRGAEQVSRDAFGLLIGRVNPAQVVELDRAPDGSMSIAHGILPGSYTYLASDGVVAQCELDEVRAEIVLGEAELVLHAQAEARYGLAPVGGDELLRLLAARLAPRADRRGELRIGGLRPGGYHVVGEAGLILMRVEVEAPSTTVELE